MLIGITVGNRKAKPLICLDIFGKATIMRKAVKLCFFAEIFAAGAAVTALPARPSQPGMPTLSPILNRPASFPHSTTRPTTSWPSTNGSFALGRSPSATCRSVRQTAQAHTRTKIWLGPGLGLDTRNCRSGVFADSRTIACIVSSFTKRVLRERVHLLAGFARRIPAFDSSSRNRDPKQATHSLKF